MLSAKSCVGPCTAPRSVCSTKALHLSQPRAPPIAVTGHCSLASRATLMRTPRKPTIAKAHNHSGNMSQPTLYYWPIRGRMEVVRLLLAQQGVEYKEEKPENMKTDRAAYPFGQAPRFKDEIVDMCQSNSIIRYLGRKYGMDGKTEQEKVLVDQAMELVESLRTKYLTLIYQDQLSDAAKETFYKTHISKDSASERNGGAHVSFLEWCATRAPEGGLASSGLTVGDLALWEITDILLRIFPDQIATEYPALKAFHAKIAALPNVAAYLASEKRPAQVNGNPLG